MSIFDILYGFGWLEFSIIAVLTALSYGLLRIFKSQYKGYLRLVKRENKRAAAIARSKANLRGISVFTLLIVLITQFASIFVATYRVSDSIYLSNTRELQLSSANSPLNMHPYFNLYVPDDFDAADEMPKLVAQMEEKNAAVLTDNSTPAQLLGTSPDTSTDEYRIMKQTYIVNSEFISLEKPKSSDNKSEIQIPNDKSISVLIPDIVTEGVEDKTGLVKAIIDMESQLLTNMNPDEKELELSSGLQSAQSEEEYNEIKEKYSAARQAHIDSVAKSIKTYNIASDQTFRNYGASAGQTNTQTSLNPILLVINAKADILTPNYYTFQVQNAKILFSDSEVFQQAAEKSNLQDKLTDVIDRGIQIHELDASIHGQILINLLEIALLAILAAVNFYIFLILFRFIFQKSVHKLNLSEKLFVLLLAPLALFAVFQTQQFFYVDIILGSILSFALLLLVSLTGVLITKPVKNKPKAE